MSSLLVVGDYFTKFDLRHQNHLFICVIKIIIIKIIKKYIYICCGYSRGRVPIFAFDTRGLWTNPIVRGSAQLDI